MCLLEAPDGKVGFMLQQDSLFEWRTILDNVMLGPEIMGADKAAARRRAERLLTNYGLGNFMHHKPGELSGGMRQRVALARTDVHAAGIAAARRARSRRSISRRAFSISDEIGAIIREERKTAILVTHDIPEAISMADRCHRAQCTAPGASKRYIPFPSQAPRGQRPGVLDAREAPEFAGYFHQVWEELEVHV